MASPKKEVSHINGAFYSNSKRGHTLVMYHSGKVPNNRELKMLRAKLRSHLRLIEKTISFLENPEFNVEDHNKSIVEPMDTYAPHWTKRATVVYLMHDPISNLSKIGVTADLQQRLSALKADRPLLSVLAQFRGSIKEERIMQKKYIKYQVHGEWFSFPNSELDSIIRNFLV